MSKWDEADEKGLKKLVGRTIKKICMNEEYLVFYTDEGEFAYTVEGDCCSSSYFHDFYGVTNLLDKEVVEVGTVSLATPDQLTADEWEEIAVYGFKIVFNGSYGEQTAVFSFRNSSNGYYGGMMYPVDGAAPKGVPELKKDTVLI